MRRSLQIKDRLDSFLRQCVGDFLLVPLLQRLAGFVLTGSQVCVLSEYTSLNLPRLAIMHIIAMMNESVYSE